MKGKPDATAIRVFKKKQSGGVNTVKSFENREENEDFKFGTNFEDSMDSSRFTNTKEHDSVADAQDDHHNSGEFGINANQQSNNPTNNEHSGFVNHSDRHPSSDSFVNHDNDNDFQDSDRFNNNGGHPFSSQTFSDNGDDDQHSDSFRNSDKKSGSQSFLNNEDNVKKSGAFNNSSGKQQNFGSFSQNNEDDYQYPEAFSGIEELSSQSDFSVNKSDKNQGFQKSSVPVNASNNTAKNSDFGGSLKNSTSTNFS